MNKFANALRILVFTSPLLAWSCLSFADKPTYYIYLAGPEVFLKDPVAAGEQKKALIRAVQNKNSWPFELVGLYPMDNVIEDFKPNVATGMRIYHANLELMHKADFIAANMVRFRGPSMDVGTAFEMGFMAGSNKPVFAYYESKPFYGSNEKPAPLHKRVQQHWGLSKTDPSLDKDGIHIENFDMSDNLMMIGAQRSTGYPIASNFEQTIYDIVDFIVKNK